MAGVLDGVSLNHLEPGLTYEVEESLGAYLASTESAIEVPFDDSPVMGSKDEALIERVARGTGLHNDVAWLENLSYFVPETLLEPWRGDLMEVRTRMRTAGKSPRHIKWATLRHLVLFLGYACRGLLLDLIERCVAGFTRAAK